MAKGKKLMLALGLDLSSFDAAFAAADSTAKKRRDAISKSLSDVSKQFEIQINKAKLSGDAERALALDTERLATKVELLKRAEQNLAKVREDTIKRGNAKEIAAVEAEYQNAIIRRQKMELAYKSKLNTSGANGIGNAFKQFAMNSRYGGILTTITANAEALTSASSALGVTLSGAVAGGFAAAGAAVVAYNKALEHAEEIALKAAEDGRAALRLMSAGGLKQSEAEQLGDAFAIAGENADGAVVAISKLSKAVLDAGTKGNETTKALEKWNVSLLDSDGKLKKFTDRISALADAYKIAKAAGLGDNFGAEIFGGRAGTMLPVLEKWERVFKLAGNANSTGFMNAQVQDMLLSVKAQADAVERHIDSRFGDILAPEMLEHYERIVKMNNENAESIKKSRGEYEAFAKAVGRMLENWDAVTGKIKEATLAVEKFGMKLMRATEKSDLMKDIQNFGDLSFGDKALSVLSNAGIPGLIKGFFNGWKEASNEALTETTKAVDNAIEKENKKLTKEAEALKEKQKQIADAEKNAEAQKNAEAEAKKREAEQKRLTQERIREEQRVLAEWKKQEQERINAEQRIQNVLQSGFQNRMQQIEQEKQAWIKAGADEARATIAAEKQKADARKSEAEKALTSQKNLWKAYLKFGDTEQFQQFALNDKLKSLGISKKEYATMDTSRLSGFVEAMNKFQNNTWFAQLNSPFANAAGDMARQGVVGNQTVNNNVNNTVTIDRPVLTDESLINQLVDRVSERMVAVAEKAFGNRAQNTFG